MTIQMPDSITPGNLPMGYRAYLGYPDGDWPTAARLPQLFPGAKVVALTVNGSTLDNADGVDVEPGNINAAGGAAWVKRKLATGPAERPVVYASIEGEGGYGMGDVLAELGKLGISRAKVRLLSAHYGQGEHICSPSACQAGKDTGITADGTQWTSTFGGVGGNPVDMSLLGDGFFADGNAAHISVWDLVPSQVTQHGAVLGWEHTGGVGAWRVGFSGPGFPDVEHDVSKPQAVFSGLTAASEYTVRVTSLVDGKPAGITGIKTFRTAE